MIYTRRQFGKLLAIGTGAAVGAEYLARRKERLAYAAGSPFTIALVPDPQYLAGDGSCSSQLAYNSLVQWAITNRNLPVNGIPLNIKGFLQVGDCCNTVSSSVFDAQQQISVNAYALAEAATPRMFVARCAGNHDYQNGASGPINRNSIGYMFRTDTNGAWSPANVASIYSGGMDLGSGDSAVFGGAYADPVAPVSTANSYMRLSIQGVKIGIASVELFPRSAVLNWVRDLQNTYSDHQWWVTTHAYMDTLGARFTRTQANGPNPYSMADAPASNSGEQMWFGSDASWLGFTKLPNLTGVFGGHAIDGWQTPGWVWRQMTTASTSARGQLVQQVFCNAQNQDGGFCNGVPGGPNDGVNGAIHLMLLRIDPVTSMMEAFMLSTNANKWIGLVYPQRSSSTPIQLFNVSLQPPLPRGSPSTAVSGPAAIRRGKVH